MLAALLTSIAACSVQHQANQSGSEAGKSSNGSAEVAGQQSSEVTKPAAPRPPQNGAERQLDEALRQLGQNFDGKLGIAVRDLESGWTAHFNGNEFLPQQSVSKLWVAITLLERVDRGEIDLAEKVTLRRDDLTLFYQPIRRLILNGDGYTTTIGDLLDRAMMRSDNTANDYLLRRVGGPEAVREMLRRKQLSGIRFGPGERELQSGIAGLEWRPEYALGRAFFDARDEVPSAKREAAFQSYVEEPVDGATPIAIASALARLRKGELLSPASTERLLSVMSRSKSGPRRLKGGVEGGWSVAHKTGTGQVLDQAQAGYNDVGLVTSPDGRT